MFLASFSGSSFVDILAKTILVTIDQEILRVFMLVLIFTLVVVYDRMSFTENKYIHKTLFSTHEYSKKTHRIVGRGYKEEYHHSVGNDRENTEYWK